VNSSLLSLYILTIHRPQNAKELFNLRHSSLRNVIERIFGVLKRRFKVLRTAPEYAFDTQVKLVYALTALHNFIQTHITEEEEEVGLDDASVLREDTVGRRTERIIEDSTITSSRMDARRDDIAEAMWEDYTTYLAR
jgi:hypothetical protein